MNNELPIWLFKDQIVSTVRDHPVVIITAETGAGKSTQVPQFLLEAGYTMVVTQPRRLAARTVSERVAEEVGCEFGSTVGFRTAYERQDSGATECLFCTDGLALVRELMGAGQHQVLVIDEVHEWNLNIEVLVAWTKLQLGRGANFKVVVMSATLEADKLSEFFGGAPIINVPGRMFPVEVRTATARDDAGEAIALLQDGRNVLVFEPGKREIAEVAELIRQSSIGAEIIALHGELEPAEQARAFRQYGRAKCVIATNVAETSVTINDIDAVVDSGMERRVEVVDGVEGLYLRPISRANSTQRKGRAGRCKQGIYVDRCPAMDRPEFPVAEILRSRLDQTVLRLAEAGFDMEELEFFHQPAKSEIHEAKRALKALGCMDEIGRVTFVGRQVSRLPISVQYARMIVEADKLGVVDDVVTIAAILEQGGITARPQDKYEKPKWLILCLGEFESDLMAQLMVWKRADGMRPDEMRENGVHVKAFFQAKEKRRHIAESLRGRVREFKSSGQREKILRAVCAGMVDHLYQYQYGDWKNGDGQVRQLNRDSIVQSAGQWIVGLPFDLEIQTRRGKMTLHLITMVTRIEPSWLVEIAPHLVKLEQGLNPSYDPASDCCLSTCKTVFNGQAVAEVREATPEHPEASRLLAEWLSGQMV
jgi:ATP-dependent helicase HrpA